VSQAQSFPEHVEILSPVKPLAFPAEWYDLSARDHFWFRWRFAAVRRLFAQLRIDPTMPAQALDVGCGSGILRDQLEQATAWTIDGVDLNLEALARARRGRGQLFYYDISERNPRFTGRYDYVLLFDVLEHIEPTPPFVEAVTRLLRPGGRLVVNVPALQLLFSQYDTAAGHFRRYTISTLAREFDRAGLVAEGAAYWGFSLVPLLMVRRALIRRVADPGDVIRFGFKPPTRLINRLLSTLGQIETTVLRRPPTGTSVLMALRKT